MSATHAVVAALVSDATSKENLPSASLTVSTPGARIVAPAIAGVLSRHR
jgi:hypothetical protein